MNIRKVIREEMDDLEWMSGPTQVRFGDIKDNFKDYITVGDTIYLSGILALTDLPDVLDRPSRYIILNMEPVTVIERPDHSNHLNVKFGGGVTSQVNWLDHMSSDWVDIGGVPSDDDIMIMIPRKTQDLRESDDLDWIREIQPINLHDGNWIIHNDVENTPKEDRKLQEFLYDRGFKWVYDLTIDEMADGESHYIFKDGNDNLLDGYTHWNSSLEEMVEEGFTLYKWSDIKKYYNLNNELNESEEDDLDWIREIPRDLTVTNENYYVGARVILKEDSEYKFQSEIPGVINGFYSDRTEDLEWFSNIWIGVTWDNGDETHIYRIGPNAFDLDFYFEPPIDN